MFVHGTDVLREHQQDIRRKYDVSESPAQTEPEGKKKWNLVEKGKVYKH